MAVRVYPSQSITSRLRLGLTLIIVLIVILSPVVMVVNPALIAAPLSKERSGTDAAPSTISQEGDFTAQAPLQIPRTLQSNDLVNSLAFYEVIFITSTTGAIDKIRMDFPAGTGVAAAGIIERVGIGGGTLLKSGSSITYDVTSPVSIPAGTFIRLEMFGIKNPITPSTTFTADITTRDSAGTLIDGPSQTNVYTIKKVGSSDLADGSVTSTKPAESFMKKVTLFDDAAGNALGWNPDGVTTVFSVVEPLAGSPDPLGSNAIANILDGTVCNAGQVFFGIIELHCITAPSQGTSLDYTVINLPSHLAT